jgi:hypothetical protein
MIKESAGGIAHARGPEIDGIRARGRASAAVLAAMALSLFLSAGLFAEAPSIDERLAAIRGFGSRVEGSQGEAEALGYIEASLRGMGLSPDSRSFDDAAEDYSASRIVEAAVPGNRADELAIIVPVGSWIDAPDGSAGAYALSLALDEAARLSADRIAGKSLPISIRFVFLGAERRGLRADGRIASLGSRTWIARQEGRARLAVLYLDLDEPSADPLIELRSAGKGVISPYWYYEGMRKALESSKIPYDIEANRQEAYRLGLASDFGPAAPYLEGGLPAIELRGAAPGGESSLDSSWFAAIVARFAEANAGGFLDSWDRHYFIIELGRSVWALREQSYVAALVGLVAFIALAMLATSVARRRALKRFARRAPTFVAQVLALFAALVGITLFGRGLTFLETAILGSSKAWTLLPRIFVTARILFCFLLFLSVLSYLVERRRLTPNPHFYEFIALVCLVIDVLVFSVADLSASFYFIWALVVVEASLAIRRRWASALAFVLMYTPLLVIAGELLIRPDLAAYGRVIAPAPSGVAGFTALALPFFVFAASPLLSLSPPGTAARRRAAALFGALALATELTALVAFKVAVPADGPGRGDVSITEFLDQDSGRFELRLEGAQRLGKGRIARGESSLAYATASDMALLTGEDRGRRIEIEETRSPFLDRVDEKLRIVFDPPPYELEFKLESDEEMLLYDCSLPYKLSVDGRSATIYAGVNPGRVCSFTLTVPESFSSRLTARARYLRPLEPYAQSSGAPLRFTGQLVTASRAIVAAIPGVDRREAGR